MVSAIHKSWNEPSKKNYLKNPFLILPVNTTTIAAKFVFLFSLHRQFLFFLIPSLVRALILLRWTAMRRTSRYTVGSANLVRAPTYIMPGFMNEISLSPVRLIEKSARRCSSGHGEPANDLPVSPVARKLNGFSITTAVLSPGEIITRVHP